MARHVETIEHYLDDLDGGKAEGTIAFSFEGTSYEIDLSKKNRAAMTKALAPYVDAARKVRASRRRSARSTVAQGSTRSAGANKDRLKAIRQWARSNGIEVADRGRISQDLQDRYDAAQ